MTVQTSVIWNDVDLTEQLTNVIFDEVQILIGQGKTDGVNEKLENTPIAGQNTNIRTWDGQQTAEEWIIFINSLGINPVSSGILPA
jgi:hypothetical protein